jgi:predicted PurR-regulated permease PerM
MGCKPKEAIQTTFFILTMILMLIPAFYFAKPILLPVIFSAFIALLFSPLVNYLARIGIPRAINAMVVLMAFIGLILLSLYLLSEPAQQWWSKLPTLMNQFTEATKEVTEGSGASSELANTVANGELPNGTIFSVLETLIITAPTIVAQLMVVLFTAYFMMIYGRQLFTQALRLFKDFSTQRQAVELIKRIQKDLSLYIVSITLVNAGLAFCVGVVFYAMDIEDPFLWGAFAGVMNFIPYLGPMVSVICFTLVTYLQFSSLSYAFTVAATFLLINLIESQLITPTLLGKRFSLNPLVLFLWLMFWGWLWGAMGMLIAVPILVCVNVALERIDYFGNSYLILRVN